MNKPNQLTDYVTNVVLVVIPNAQNKILTHDKFFKLFSAFGTIQRILIFERGIQWKTFIEYDTHESAVRARTALNGQDFGEDNQLKMSVFASPLKRITLSEINNTSGVGMLYFCFLFKDYTQLRQKIEEKANSNARTPVTPNAITQSLSLPPQGLDDSWQFQQIQQQSQFYQQPIFDSSQFNFTYLQLQTNFQQQMFSQLQEINIIMLKLQKYYNIQPTSQQIFSSNESQIPVIAELLESQKKFGFLLEQLDVLQRQFRSFLSNQNQSSPLIHNSYEINNLKQEYNQILREEKELSDSQVPIQFVQAFQEENMADLNVQQKAKEMNTQFTEIKNQTAQHAIKSNGLGEEHKTNNQKLKGYNIESVKQPNFQDRVYDEEAADEDLIYSCFRTQDNQRADLGLKRNLQRQKSVGEIEEKEKPKAFIHKDRTPQLQRNPNPPFKKNNNLQDMDNNLDPSEYVNPLFLKVIRKSKVIYARWFDRKIISLKMLYNLFSTYGNIEKMIFLKERSSVLVQYQTQEYTQQAKDCLNDINFYGSSIKIFFSNYDEIFLKTPNIEKGQFLENSQEEEEYFLGCEDTNRFKVECNYSFLPPSEILSILNIPKQQCTNEFIQDFFEEFGKVEKTKQLSLFVQHPNSKNICYIKLESCEAAVKALANLHGSEINGRIIHIMFSKYNF